MKTAIKGGQQQQDKTATTINLGGKMCKQVGPTINLCGMAMWSLCPNMLIVVSVFFSKPNANPNQLLGTN